MRPMTKRLLLLVAVACVAPLPRADAVSDGNYPLPALYVGTCGVVAGGGAAPAAPASPVTNSAGQVVVSTGC